MGWANSDIELEKRESIIQSLNIDKASLKEQLEKKESELEIIQSELFKAKTKLGEVFNLILEYGNKDIIDMVEGIISQE